MKVLENYVSYKRQITQLELDLRWLNKRIEMLNITESDENEKEKIEKIIFKKKETELQLNTYKNYVGYIDVILEALKEKYEGEQYELFNMRYIQKRSLKYISRQTNHSTTIIKKITDKVVIDLEKLTSVLISD